MLTESIETIILKATGAEAVTGCELLQTLWSGYGQLLRVKLNPAPASVIVKLIQPSGGDHRYGWNDDFSHKRKLKSYQVEWAWYKHYNNRRTERCTYPAAVHLEQSDNGSVFILEDLDGLGFSERPVEADDEAVSAVLKWLAELHGVFLGVAPNELWQTGTYWHLATRPQELAALKTVDPRAEPVAAYIDRKLNDAAYQTIVHGDAKFANFCFNKPGNKVAAVDFQYVGGGPGIKDVAYFLSSVYGSAELYTNESRLLDEYCSALTSALERHGRPDGETVALEWRSLYDLAWADFVRFLQGWQPNHWKVHAYGMEKWQKATGLWEATP